MRLGFLLVQLAGLCSQTAAPLNAPTKADSLLRLLPSAEWEATFWASDDAKHLLTLTPAAIADLVPAQAGLRWCACPACYATEQEEPLQWSPRAPAVVTCRKCGVKLPNDDYPAKVAPGPGVPPVVPEEAVEVAQYRFHKYPFHTLPAERQRYPDERVYLTARRDYAAREWLFKAALYAATQYHRQRTSASRDPRLAQACATIVLRYAQVYPTYAVHTDQPGRPPVFQSATLRPPYRAGFTTCKGDWQGCLDVPIPLLLAYAVIRDDPAVASVARELKVENARAQIEEKLFRAAAHFTLGHPSEMSEKELCAARGILLTGWLLGDVALTEHGEKRLCAYVRHEFAPQAEAPCDRAELMRVTQALKTWIAPIYADNPAEPTQATLAWAFAQASALDPGRADPLVNQAKQPIPPPR